jgi:oxaloacetate decarboxylase alpha subunit
VLNIVTSERYRIVPDEVIQYAAKHYGEPVAAIDANVLDRILASPRAKEIVKNPPEQPTIEELRRRYGTSNDDELLLKALVPEADLKKMHEAGPIKRTFPLLSSPELDQVVRLMTIAKSPVVQFRSAELSVDLVR